MNKIVATAALLLVTTWFAACSKAEPPLDANIGQAGDTVLLGDYHHMGAIVFHDQGLYDPRPLPPDESERLQHNGAIWLPEQGTRAKVISTFHPRDGVPGNDARLVEILDGKFQGKQGYVCWKCLAKP
jgi:hypothetical protein